MLYLCLKLSIVVVVVVVVGAKKAFNIVLEVVGSG